MNDSAHTDRPNADRMKHSRETHRRVTLLKNTAFSAIGYIIPYCGLIIARQLHLSSTTNAQLVTTGLWIAVTIPLFWYWIYTKRYISKGFVQRLTYLQLLNWALIFCYMTSYLNELRLFSLYCGYLGLVFLLTGSGFWVSFLLSLLIVGCHGFIAYYCIYILGQQGDFTIELFYLAVFFFTAMFLCKAAGLFSAQRKSIIIAKRKAEENVVKLAKAKKDADAANKSKSAFMANMSHELRTPLNHIIGFSEVVADQRLGQLNEKQLQYLNNVVSSGTHLLSLVNDILDIAKVEAGKMELNISEIKVHDILLKAIDVVDNIVREKKLHIRMNIAENTTTSIFADQRALYQVLSNLLSNAVKFTPDNGSITVSARQEAINRVTAIKFSVSDDGIGIAAEDIGRIVNPFEQADNSTQRQYEGTGLGLALSEKLVELHGGTFYVFSDGKGKGSEFSFILPVRSPLHL